MTRNREIVWRPYVWGEPRAAKPHEIEALEREWGVTLPKEYKELVSEYQGMTPQPNVFSVGATSESAINELLTVTRDEGREGYLALGVYQALKPHVPKGIYPFASTPGGESVCFDYREGSLPPRIVLVSVECDLYPLAESFSDFLAGLHD
ncbi:SMI1/KNR4 family protein [Hyalangium rubrum]|uniref:SMI1/KNR4 family protein n=1 Tax=Hyalangium rubrum TaxID=3103134 RepID=A0ABU5H1Z9_9BACT|nr:SMI1/KNR4 family protein [Hyalangium sp. s54d21]MDY7226934.1 SMI1/KNR4 family protein [Hyalangium sp. s54d21]